jgi:hypothetical protein
VPVGLWLPCQQRPAVLTLPRRWSDSPHHPTSALVISRLVSRQFAGPCTKRMALHRCRSVIDQPRGHRSMASAPRSPQPPSPTPAAQRGGPRSSAWHELEFPCRSSHRRVGSACQPRPRRAPPSPSRPADARLRERDLVRHSRPPNSLRVGRLRAFFASGSTSLPRGSRFGPAISSTSLDRCRINSSHCAVHLALSQKVCIKGTETPSR